MEEYMVVATVRKQGPVGEYKQDIFKSTDIDNTVAFENHVCESGCYSSMTAFQKTVDGRWVACYYRRPVKGNPAMWTWEPLWGDNTRGDIHRAPIE